MEDTEILQGFSQLPGVSQVDASPDTREQVEQATFPLKRQVRGVIFPASRQGVQECVRYARQRGVSLYAVSRGFNWGLGSKVPAHCGDYVLDLGRLNRIAHHDPVLGTATLEPGVTQRQLSEYLAEHNSSFILNVTGSSPDSSVIGNIVERGDAAGPYADRFANSCGMGVVLPNGEHLETTFGEEFPELGRAYRWGLGPFLEGLFTQSNLGIVTSMTVWLSPRPKHLDLIRFGATDVAELSAFMGVIRQLRLEGTLRGGVGLHNDYRIVSLHHQYPWELAPHPPLPRDVLGKFREAHKKQWHGTLMLESPTREQAQASLRRSLALLTEVSRDVTASTLDAEALQSQKDPLLGAPSTIKLRSMYWRKRMPVPAAPSPERDRCGVHWLCFGVPLIGERIADLVTGVESTILKHRLEPMLSFGAAGDRSVILLTLLAYDRELPGEDENAMRCHDAVLERAASLGCSPVRMGIQTMPKWKYSATKAALLRELKQALDPDLVLAPGRYIPLEAADD